MLFYGGGTSQLAPGRIPSASGAVFSETVIPSTSGPQHRLMEMVDHNPAAAKRLGIPQSVGRDFVEADKRAHKHFPNPRSPHMKESSSEHAPINQHTRMAMGGIGSEGHIPDGDHFEPHGGVEHPDVHHDHTVHLGDHERTAEHPHPRKGHMHAQANPDHGPHHHGHSHPHPGGHFNPLPRPKK